jgi:hypothetical protein
MESDMTSKWKALGSAAFASALATVLAAPAASFPLPRDMILSKAGKAIIAVSAAHRKRAAPHWSSRRQAPLAYRPMPAHAPGCPGLYSWNPANPDRGYCDPGFAYHGNINGCVVDQGYGRWISCDSMMR